MGRLIFRERTSEGPQASADCATRARCRHYRAGAVAFVLTLPLTVLTLGLFLLVLNAAMVGLVAWVVLRRCKGLDGAREGVAILSEPRVYAGQVLAVELAAYVVRAAVTGLFMRLGYHGGTPGRGCCGAEDAADARRVSDLAGDLGEELRRS